MKIPIFQIKINDGRREADQEAVHKLADSITKIGLLNPITIDQDYNLIAGLHRLEAAKLLGWTEIESNVSSLEGLMAELAEIDENLIRCELNFVDESEQLARRKDLYEMLYPETKRGAKNQYTKNAQMLTDTVSVSKKSFADDTAETMGISPRTVSRKIQLAKNLSPEAKDIVKSSGIGVKNALKISRLVPEQQAEAASQLAAGTIRSLEEYRPSPAELEAAEEKFSEMPQEPEPPAPPKVHKSASAPGDCCPSIQELAADLKNPDKDRRCTPDSFLVTLSYFLQRFCQSMENYTGPEYDAVLPVLTQQHLDQIHQKIQLVHKALDEMYYKIERMAQNEAT